jgi:hypothetical protein
LTEVVQILGVDYRRAYESDSRSVPARPVTADAIVSNIRSGARGKYVGFRNDVSSYEYDIEVPEPDPSTRERVVDTSDVKGQIELALENALAEIEPELHAQLQAAYREQVDKRFAWLLESAADPSKRMTPKRDKWEAKHRPFNPDKIYVGDDWRWHKDVSFDVEASREFYPSDDSSGHFRTPAPEFDHIFRGALWSTLIAHPELYSVTYEHADATAKEHLDNAHASFVSKNLQKLMFVIGDRKDFEEIAIRVGYSQGAFEGTVDLRLSDTEIHADLGLKYVLRTIPNLTPYWQYPLVFTHVVVRGEAVERNSFGIIPEEDVRKAVAGKRAPTKGEEAVKKGLCSMSGAFAPEGTKLVRYGMSAYARCPECGENATVKNGKFRAHKTPETLRAELLAKGFCEMSDMPVPSDAARGKFSDERTCPVCGRSVGVTSSGKFRQHKGKRK